MRVNDLARGGGLEDSRQFRRKESYCSVLSEFRRKEACSVLSEDKSKCFSGFASVGWKRSGVGFQERIDGKAGGYDVVVRDGDGKV